MAFFELVLKARTIYNAKLRYEDEKLHSIEIFEGRKPRYTLAQWHRHQIQRCKKWISHCWHALTSCPENSWFHKKSVLLRTDGSFENYILKSIIGFFGGILLTYIFFIFFVFQLKLSLSSATILCSIIGVILTLGLAFSYRVRCLVFLLLPLFFSKRGRQALMAYAFILALTGPAENALHNIGVLAESLACGQDELKQAIKTVVDLVKQPFYALKDAIAKIVKNVKTVVKKIKESLIAIKRLVLSILRVITAVFQWLGSIVNICNKKLGTPFERCQRVFDGAVADCKAKLGPFLGGICNLAYMVGLLCYVVKPLDFICMLVSYVADTIVGTVRKKVKKFTKHMKAMFYVKVKFSHSYHFETNQSKSIEDISTGIIREIRSRTDKFITVFDWMSFATCFFILFMLLRVYQYRYKWLTNDRFDNRYLTDDLRDIDLIRARQSKETALPLNPREKHMYIPLTSVTLVKTERVKLAKSAVFLCLATFKLCIHMMADYSLHWVLSLIRYHGRFESKVQQPNVVSVHVSGDGYLSGLYRSVVKSFSPHTSDIELDSMPCLPDPNPPDLDRYTQIGMLVVFCWLMTIFEPYGLRLRQVVMCRYHPERARQRAAWLYNHIIRSRGNFLKFARRQLRRKFGMTGGGLNIEKVTLKERIVAICPILYRCFPEKRNVCLLCGAVERLDSNPHIKCPTPNCLGLFCIQCYGDLQNVCTICKAPMDYGDLSDMSEEKDSSEDQYTRKVKAEKKKRKFFSWGKGDKAEEKKRPDEPKKKVKTKGQEKEKKKEVKKETKEKKKDKKEMKKAKDSIEGKRGKNETTGEEKKSEEDENIKEKRREEDLKQGMTVKEDDKKTKNKEKKVERKEDKGAFKWLGSLLNVKEQVRIDTEKEEKKDKSEKGLKTKETTKAEKEQLEEDQKPEEKPRAVDEEEKQIEKDEETEKKPIDEEKCISGEETDESKTAEEESTTEGEKLEKKKKKKLDAKKDRDKKKGKEDGQVIDETETDDQRLTDEITSDTSYSYSYQEESADDAILAPQRTSFRDVEAQRIRDDVTIQIFNEPLARAPSSDSEEPLPGFLLRAHRKVYRKPNKKFQVSSGEDDIENEEDEEEEVIHLEVDDASKKFIPKDRQNRGMKGRIARIISALARIPWLVGKDGGSGKKVPKKRPTLMEKTVTMLRTDQSPSSVETYRKPRTLRTHDERETFMSSTATSDESDEGRPLLKPTSVCVRDMNATEEIVLPLSDNEQNIYSQNYDSHRQLRRRIEKGVEVSSSKVENFNFRYPHEKKFTTKDLPRYLAPISKGVSYQEVDETPDRCKCVNAANVINILSDTKMSSSSRKPHAWNIIATDEKPVSHRDASDVTSDTVQDAQFQTEFSSLDEVSETDSGTRTKVKTKGKATQSSFETDTGEATEFSNADGQLYNQEDSKKIVNGEKKSTRQPQDAEKSTKIKSEEDESVTKEAEEKFAIPTFESGETSQLYDPLAGLEIYGVHHKDKNRKRSESQNGEKSKSKALNSKEPRQSEDAKSKPTQSENTEAQLKEAEDTKRETKNPKILDDHLKEKLLPQDSRTLEGKAGKLDKSVDLPDKSRGTRAKDYVQRTKESEEGRNVKPAESAQEERSEDTRTSGESSQEKKGKRVKFAEMEGLRKRGSMKRDVEASISVTSASNSQRRRRRRQRERVDKRSDNSTSPDDELVYTGRSDQVPQIRSTHQSNLNSCSCEHRCERETHDDYYSKGQFVKGFRPILYPERGQSVQPCPNFRQAHNYQEPPYFRRYSDRFQRYLAPFEPAISESRGIAERSEARPVSSEPRQIWKEAHPREGPYCRTCRRTHTAKGHSQDQAYTCFTHLEDTRRYAEHSSGNYPQRVNRLGGREMESKEINDQVCEERSRFFRKHVPVFDASALIDELKRNDRMKFIREKQERGTRDLYPGQTEHTPSCSASKDEEEERRNETLACKVTTSKMSGNSTEKSDPRLSYQEGEPYKKLITEFRRRSLPCGIGTPIGECIISLSKRADNTKEVQQLFPRVNQEQRQCSTVRRISDRMSDASTTTTDTRGTNKIGDARPTRGDKRQLLDNQLWSEFSSTECSPGRKNTGLTSSSPDYTTDNN